MEKKLNHRELRTIVMMREGDKPKPFSLRYVKKSTGEVVDIPKAVLTSYHEKGGTINILKEGETTPKSIVRCLITHINGFKLYY